MLIFKIRTAVYVRVFIMVVLMFFMMHRFFFYQPGILEHCASRIVYPFLYVQRLIVKPFQRFFEWQRSHAQLETIIEQLRAEKHALLAEVVAAHSTLWYQEKTKELCNFLAQYSLEACSCVQIIMKQNVSNEHSFLIGYGSNQGAEVNMIALYKNCIIGRICNVYPSYSKVLSITDPLCKIPVYCQHSHAKGIYEGVLDSQDGTLRFVSHLDTLIQDELVISSGEGVIFPEGFAVGKSNGSNKMDYNMLLPLNH